jgi:hypothetical protein
VHPFKFFMTHTKAEIPTFWYHLIMVSQVKYDLKLICSVPGARNASYKIRANLPLCLCSFTKGSFSSWREIWYVDDISRTQHSKCFRLSESLELGKNDSFNCIVGTNFQITSSCS